MKHLILFITLGLGLSVILAGGLIWYNQKRLQPEPATPTAPPLQTGGDSKPVSGYVDLSPKIIKTGDDAFAVELALNPQGSTVISTLTLQATLTPDQGKLVSLGSAPKVNPLFQGGGSTFPFNTLTTTPEGQIVLKTSAVYASPESFTLTQPTTFVTIPVTIPSATKNITLTIDPAVSKIYTKQSQLIHYTGASQPITMKVTL